MIDKVTEYLKKLNNRFNLLIKGKPLAKVALLLLGVVLIGLLNMVIMEKKKVLDFEKQIDRDSRAIITEVGKLIMLPGDQVPNIVKIKDLEKLKGADAAFYQNAANGDYILIYRERAIVYNPAKKIIVNVAPIFGNQE